VLQKRHLGWISINGALPVEVVTGLKDDCPENVGFHDFNRDNPAAGKRMVRFPDSSAASQNPLDYSLNNLVKFSVRRVAA